MPPPNKPLDRRRSAGAAAGRRAGRSSQCAMPCVRIGAPPPAVGFAAAGVVPLPSPPSRRVLRMAGQAAPASDCRPDSRRLSGSPAWQPILLACGSRCTGLGTAPASGLAGRRTCGAPPLPPSYRHACSPHPAPKCLEPQARVLPLGPPARGTEALSPGGPRSLRHARGENRRS